ncbi:MAG: Molybdopterin synthase catalytic subunit MoaE [uncultured Solirubrobacteraceae bacterium]|uniref:Molybdopterin synthase catalytic subunit MoaE n=1 Tax=uncultured Solirubrobacteraceae bacterium TaxID=1162706 RepID=A0A6J4RFU6_9ACTN|nr:MAG: Molybdopterin synthase catalytic subunit MoaE [uncultured Solirubrobacteraceae bacterium]
MKVRVRLFAQLRERAGSGSVELELPEGALVRDAIAAMGPVAEGLPVVMAINREYADESAVLSAGDELALIPPVSGGSSVHVAVRHGSLSLDELCRLVRDPRAGAVVTFSGVTRDVPMLDYEAYEEMALTSMRTIAEAAVERHGLCAAAVEHRVGVVPLSEASILIAVSAPHRGEAFAGGREIIDEIKLHTPIWKKEEGKWVEGSIPTSG